MPEAEPGLTRDDIAEVVRAAMADAPVPAPGLTTPEVERIVQAVVAKLPRPEPGLTRADMAAAVQAAIGELPAPEQGLTLAEIEQVVDAVVAEVAEPEPTLTREEVRRIARNAVASIPPKSAPAEFTKFFVDNAISRYRSQGLDATLSHYNRAESIDEQWYVFNVDENDKVVGHYDAHLIGEDRKGPIGVDANGYNFAGSMLDATEEGRWVSYVYRNPESEAQGTDDIGAHEYKHVWVVRHDGLLFASGWYVDTDVCTKFFVKNAISRYHDEGLEATVAYYKRPGSVNGQWFSFLADGNGKIIATTFPTCWEETSTNCLGQPRTRPLQMAVG